jgi:hypothetical protein
MYGAYGQCCQRGETSLGLSFLDWINDGLPSRVLHIGPYHPQRDFNGVASIMYPSLHENHVAPARGFGQSFVELSLLAMHQQHSRRVIPPAPVAGNHAVRHLRIK